MKRLLYEQKGFPVDVTYEGEGEIRTLKAKSGITAAFTFGEDTFSGDSIFPFSDGSGVGYRMGWNTAAVFEKSGNGFRIKSLHDPVTKEPKVSPLEKLYTAEFSQIVTQAIDTCILIFIETVNEYILAHFMESRLPDFMQYLPKLIKKEEIRSFFCSTLLSANIGNPEWKTGYNIMRQYIDGAAKQIIFERDICSNDCYFNHMEFGIGMEDDQMVYFGDIGCSTPKIRDLEETITECSCKLFAYNQVGELQGLTRIAEEVFAAEPTRP